MKLFIALTAMTILYMGEKGKLLMLHMKLNLIIMKL